MTSPLQRMARQSRRPDGHKCTPKCLWLDQLSFTPLQTKGKIIIKFNRKITLIPYYILTIPNLNIHSDTHHQRFALLWSETFSKRAEEEEERRKRKQWWRRIWRQRRWLWWRRRPPWRPRWTLSSTAFASQVALVSLAIS